MKKNIDVARAWRDQDYYLSLTAEERAELGVHPAGAMEMADEVLRSIAGGCCNSVNYCATSPYCSPCPPYDCY
jgi:mersacidin/lichenicidin family type 2 lantibiotic